jgi:Asp-tRNA(Asn)/Glu-tRNA(Gln) amidotransferase A subunit family amidase
MPTAYGSPIYRGDRPAGDASCVALACAGAVVLGKTTLRGLVGAAKDFGCNHRWTR